MLTRIHRSIYLLSDMLEMATLSVSFPTSLDRMWWSWSGTLNILGSRRQTALQRLASCESVHAFHIDTESAYVSSEFYLTNDHYFVKGPLRDLEEKFGPWTWATHVQYCEASHTASSHTPTRERLQYLLM